MEEVEFLPYAFGICKEDTMSLPTMPPASSKTFLKTPDVDNSRKGLYNAKQFIEREEILMTYKAKVSVCSVSKNLLWWRAWRGPSR